MNHVRAHLKQPFICVQKGCLFSVLFFLFQGLNHCKKMIYQIFFNTSKGILLASEFLKSLVRY